MRAAPKSVEFAAAALEPKHVSTIGPALWVFLVFIHWQTHPDGTVMGGRPIRASEIADRLGLPLRTVQDHLRRLRPYLETKRTPHGIVYRILKPKNFSLRVRKSEPQKIADHIESEPQKSVVRTAEIRGSMNRDVKDVKGESAPTFQCSHPDCCSNGAYHVARIVAEAQGLKLPSKPGRWLKRTDELQSYGDEQIVSAVHKKVRSRSWPSMGPYWPQFLADDIQILLGQAAGANGRNLSGLLPGLDEADLLNGRQARRAT